MDPTIRPSFLPYLTPSNRRDPPLKLGHSVHLSVSVSMLAAAAVGTEK